MANESYRHEPKVIIQIPGHNVTVRTKDEAFRDREQTVLMNAPRMNGSAVQKARIAIGIAIGTIAAGTGVILKMENARQEREKATQASAAKPEIPTAEAKAADTAGFLVATAAPTTSPAATPTELPTGFPSAAEIKNSADVLPSHENSVPLAEEKPVVSAAPVSPAAVPNKKPPQKSTIIREVPF